MEMLKTIKERWCAKTPDFFKKVKNIMITLGTSASAIWMANESMNLQLHPTVLEVCKYLIAAAVASGLTAQLTRDNQSPNV
jgi:hypothetical protein